MYLTVTRTQLDSLMFWLTSLIIIFPTIFQNMFSAWHAMDSVLELYPH